jgi:zinc protease
MAQDVAALEASASLSERVEERQVGSCRLLTLHSPVEDVVSFRGSFFAQPDFGSGEELVQDLTVSLLDKGTRKRDRFAIADLLENRGAQLRFSSDGLRVRFSGRALREDLTEVLAVLGEQLLEPLFDEAEFVKARAQLTAALRHSLESTGAQASGALSRLLYAKAHPNHTRSAEAELSRLQEIGPEQIRQYHTRHFGSNDLLLVLSGDVDAERAEHVVRESLGAWAPHQAAPPFDVQASPQGVERTEVFMPDKSNIDVRMGHSLSVRRSDPDYLRLYVGNYVLGGNFSARLMATVRDEMGLTYGIHSALSGISSLYAGHWHVSVTLSQGAVERGMEATMDQMRQFVEEGIRADELDEKQTTINGSYKVGLGTTGGLAAVLLHHAEQGFDAGYIDQYPLEVNALTLDEVNEAIRTHFHPEHMRVALAGTF